LIRHVLERVSEVTGNIVIVARTPRQMEKLKQVLQHDRITLDEMRAQSPLVGFLTGLRSLRTEYVFSTSCDAPFIQPRLVRSLFEFALGNDCAVPVLNGRIEPLVAVYNRRSALRASTVSLAHGKMTMLGMIAQLKKPVYVSKANLRRADPGLLSFQNVNTMTELSRARRILRAMS
jgi:molybdopterin-guanine dinucleotide biosynthesis protein A